MRAVIAFAVIAVCRRQCPGSDRRRAATGLSPLGSYDYRIGPGDVLSIRVSGVREFDQSIRVSNSGRIRVPTSASCSPPA